MKTAVGMAGNGAIASRKLEANCNWQASQVTQLSRSTAGAHREKGETQSGQRLNPAVCQWRATGLLNVPI